ncbi:unnamed protein product [Schistocephalus solidus]|uniref:Reverse transcriptase domain-containing protein n=1 Tax=Schistocephalus solidus TaxID=70667 RepID=A0A3P7CHJ1_SCHSO|nr:unnamed protein product [Schistocephalus solidus]
MLPFPTLPPPVGPAIPFFPLPSPLLSLLLLLFLFFPNSSLSHSFSLTLFYSYFSPSRLLALPSPFPLPPRSKRPKLRVTCSHRRGSSRKANVASDDFADAYRDECPWMRIAYRTDGHLLNCRRMQALTCVSTTIVHDLLFVDEFVLNTVMEEDMQRSMNLFAAGCANFGLIINTAKTLVMHQPPPSAE